MKEKKYFNYINNIVFYSYKIQKKANGLKIIKDIL